MKSNKVKTYKHMTAEDFTEIKTLLKLKFNQTQIHKHTKKSFNTISCVSKAANFEEYKQLVKEMTAKYAKKEAVKPESETAPLFEEKKNGKAVELPNHNKEILEELSMLRLVILELKAAIDDLNKDQQIRHNQAMAKRNILGIRV